MARQNVIAGTVLAAVEAAVIAALEDDRHRIVAIATFLVVASGVHLLGIGSAFWGLVVGGALMLLFRPKRLDDAVQTSAR